MNDLQAAVQKLYDEHGSGYCFPSDLIWKYLTGLQPNGTAKPGLIKALDRENYIVSTGRMTKAVSGTRKGSPTKEYTFGVRSEEHTSELQSLMRISYAVFCLKKKKTKNNIICR